MDLKHGASKDFVVIPEFCDTLTTLGLIKGSPETWAAEAAVRIHVGAHAGGSGAAATETTAADEKTKPLIRERRDSSLSEIS